MLACTISTISSDFLIVGPMTDPGLVFPGAVAVMSILFTLAYDEVRSLPRIETHPLNLLFPDVTEKLLQEARED